MNTTTPGTMGARGQQYVAAWPTRIAEKTGLSPAYVAEALVRTGHASQDDQTSLGRAFLRSEPADQIAALTPATAKTVITALRTISDEIDKTARTHCHYCGLTLRADGECRSCGTGA